MLTLAAIQCLPATAQEKVLNLYSARHYQTDEALYANFTRQTGIKINRIEAKEDELIERIRNEGAKSPADIFITVDAARLAKADEMGLFAPVKSKLLEERIPAHLRSPDWFAFSTRARVIVTNRDLVKAEDIQNYEDLAGPKLKGKVCSRSGSHPYNLSLMSALIAHLGEARAEEWARGVVANFARPPKGGDTDQIKSVAAGVTKAKSTETEKLIAAFKGLQVDTPFGKITYRPEDHQSTMGAFVGKTKNDNGKGVMVDYTYADGAKFQPPAADVKKFRTE